MHLHMYESIDDARRLSFLTNTPIVQAMLLLKPDSLLFYQVTIRVLFGENWTLTGLETTPTASRRDST